MLLRELALLQTTPRLPPLQSITMRKTRDYYRDTPTCICLFFFKTLCAREMATAILIPTSAP